MTSPSCHCRSSRSPTTTASSRPKSTSAAPCASRPKNPTRWTSAKPGTSWPNVAGTPSPSRPSEQSRPPAQCSTERPMGPPSERRDDTLPVHDRWDQQKGEVATVADTITPPGRARVMSCPECKGTPTPTCPTCRGAGKLLVRACPLCGDIGWDYFSGVVHRDRMACRLSCSYTWHADDHG